MLVMPYGKKYTKIRKAMNSYFTGSFCDKEHLKVVNAEGVQALHDFLHKPDQFMVHPRRYATSLIMSLVYGIRGPTYGNEVFSFCNRYRC